MTAELIMATALSTGIAGHYRIWRKVKEKGPDKRAFPGSLLREDGSVRRGADRYGCAAVFRPHRLVKEFFELRALQRLNLN